MPWNFVFEKLLFRSWFFGELGICVNVLFTLLLVLKVVVVAFLVNSVLLLLK